ncbi:MAG: hypothetical protein ABIJ57_07565 [Pseudomonadota bacterium]
MHRWTERLVIVGSVIMILYGIITIYERTFGSILYWQQRALRAEQACIK